MAYNNHPQNPFGSGGGMSEDSHQYGEYGVRRERERDTYTSEGSIQEYGECACLMCRSLRCLALALAHAHAPPAWPA